MKNRNDYFKENCKPLKKEIKEITEMERSLMLMYW
jgi:hypothetical protein